MISLIVVAAIAMSIALGYKTKINIGFFAIGFAYIIGSFILDMSATSIIKTWPIKIFFIVFAVSVFYNFSINNGTLTKLAQHLLYQTRKLPQILPIAIFMLAMLTAGLGAGYYSILAFFSPITLLICEKTNINKLVGAMAVNFGCLAGSNFVTSASGIIFDGLIRSAGYADNALYYTFVIFIVSTIFPLIILSTLTFINRKKITTSDYKFQIPEPFSKKQVYTLALIIIMIITVLFFPITHKIFPHNQYITFINSKINIALIAILFSILAFLMKLGDEKQIITSIPWSTIIMICGVGMLISVAIKAGTIQLLSNWITVNIPIFLIPVSLCLVGGLMSLFASTLGVVAPALFPIVPSIASTTGISPIILFTAIIIGAQATSISPFSSGGSLILSAEKEQHKDALFNKLLFKGAPSILVACIIFFFAVSAVLNSIAG